MPQAPLRWKLPAWAPPTLLGLGLAVCLHASYFDRLLFKIDAGALFPPLWRVTPAAWAAHLRHIGGALWITLAFWGLGQRVLARRKLTLTPGFESAAVAAAVGSVLYGLAALALGLIGMLHAPLLTLLIAAGGVYGAYALVHSPPQKQALPGGLAGWALAVGAGLLLLLLPNALAPETFYDALEYHLALPKLYLLAGRITPTPQMGFAGVPALPAMLYMYALPLDAFGITAHVLAAGFAFKTCGALMGVAARLEKPAAGAWAVLLFAAIPVAQSLTYMTTVELVWAFYTVTLLSTLFALKDAAPKEEKGWTLIAGLLLGAAMSTKNLAWGLPLAIAVFPGIPRAAKVRVTLIGCAVLAPWLLKNFAHYGNPLFPFLHQLLQPQALQPAVGYLGEGAKVDWSKFPLLEIAAAPWRMMLYKRQLADSLGPVLIGVLPLLVLLRGDDESKALGRFTAAAWLPLALVVLIPRYFLPVFAPLALLLGRQLARLPGKAAGGLVLAASLLSAVVYRGLALPTAHWAAFTGEKSPGAYLSHSAEPFYHTPLYPAAEYLQNAEGVGRILLFGDARPFYLPAPYIFDMPLQRSTLERWAEENQDAAGLYACLRRHGISHVVANHGEIVRTQAALKFSVAGKQALDGVWAKYMRRVYVLGPDTMRLQSGKESLDRWLEVYKVLSPSEAAAQHRPEDLFAGYKIQ